jgi:hypothetical protein
MKGDVMTLETLHYDIVTHESNLFRDYWIKNKWVEKTYSVHFLKCNTPDEYIKIKKPKSGTVTLRLAGPTTATVTPILVTGKSLTPSGGHKKEFEKEFSYRGKSHTDAIVDEILDFFSSCNTYEIVRERKLPKPLKFVNNANPVHKRQPWKKSEQKWMYRSNMIHACTLLGIGYLRKDGKILMNGKPTSEKVWFVVGAETRVGTSQFAFIYDGGYDYYIINRKTMKITSSPLPTASWTGYLKNSERKGLRLSAGDKELLDKMIEYHLNPSS